MRVLAAGWGAFKNCDLCHGMEADAKMGQSKTGKGRGVKEFYFEKLFLAFGNKRLWPLASKLLLLISKLLLLSPKSKNIAFKFKSRTFNFKVITFKLKIIAEMVLI
jgi:hypothetical protein